MGLQDCTRKHLKSLATTGPCPPCDVVVVDGTELTKFWMGDQLPRDLYAWLEGSCRMMANKIAPALAGGGEQQQLVVFLMDWTHKVTRCKGNETAARSRAPRARPAAAAGAPPPPPPPAPVSKGAMAGAADGSEDLTGKEHALPWGECSGNTPSKKVAQIGRCVSSRQRRVWSRLMAQCGHKLLGLRANQSLLVAGDDSGRPASDAVYLTHYVKADAASGVVGGWCTEAVGGVRDEGASDGEADVLCAVVLQHVQRNRGLYDLPPAPAALRIAVTSKDTDWVVICALWLAARVIDTDAETVRALRLYWMGWKVCRPPAEMEYLDVRAMVHAWCAQADEEGAWTPLQLAEHVLNRAAALVWLGCDFTRKVKVGAAFGRNFNTVPLQEEATLLRPLQLTALHPEPGGRNMLGMRVHDDLAQRALLGRAGAPVQDLVQTRAGAYAVMYWFSACLAGDALRVVAPLSDPLPAEALRRHYLAAGFAPPGAPGALLWSWASAAAVGGSGPLEAVVALQLPPAARKRRREVVSE
jgi:hypothetical protein